MTYPGNLVIWDVETGGFYPTQNLLTQIGLIAINPEGKELLRFQAYIKPYDKNLTLTKSASDLTGITLEKLEREGRDLKEVLTEVASILKSLKVSYYMPTVVGHNVNFDMMFLEYVFNLCFAKNDETDQCALYNYIQKVPLDTIELARRKWRNNELGDFKLGTCAQYIGVENRAAHDAMGDVEVTVDLLKYLLSCLSGEGGHITQGKSDMNFQFK